MNDKKTTQAPVHPAPTPVDPGPQAPSQPTGTDTTNGTPTERPASVANAAPPPVAGITPGETPSVILVDAPAPTKKEKEVDVVLKVAYWPEEDVRKEPGETITVPISKAKVLIAQGKAEVPLSED